MGGRSRGASNIIERLYVKLVESSGRQLTSLPRYLAWCCLVIVDPPMEEETAVDTEDRRQAAKKSRRM